LALVHGKERKDMLRSWNSMMIGIGQSILRKGLPWRSKAVCSRSDQTNRVRLSVESLEERAVLSTVSPGPSFANDPLGKTLSLVRNDERGIDSPVNISLSEADGTKGGGTQGGPGYPLPPSAGPVLKGDLLAFRPPAAVFLTPGSLAGEPDVAPLGLVPNLLSTAGALSNEAPSSVPSATRIGEGAISMITPAISGQWDTLTILGLTAPQDTGTMQGSPIMPNVPSPTAIPVPAPKFRPFAGTPEVPTKSSSLIPLSMPENSSTGPGVELFLAVDSLTGSEATGPFHGDAHQFHAEFVAAGSATEGSALQKAMTDSGISSAEAVPASETAPSQAIPIGLHTFAGAIPVEVVAGYLLVSAMFAPLERDKQHLQARSSITAQPE
jgi:hypothetical protein